MKRALLSNSQGLEQPIHGLHPNYRFERHFDGRAFWNPTLLDLKTTADAANPFSAKLNGALWAAPPTGEGGNGALRVSLNKEIATGVLSFLLQSGFSGRGELGLLCSDDLTL